MKAFKKRGALTHFQILSEISKQNPHLKQKDLAKTLGITIQAVSENIKTLIEQEYITLPKKVLTKLKEMLFLLENTLILFWKQ